MNTCNECETVAHCLKHGCIPKVRSTIDMAREAGFTEGELAFMGDNFRRFAELVRADEREQALAAPVQEPVAHINQNGVIHEAGYEWGPTNELTALYATPPAQEFVCSTGLCHYKPAAPDLQAELDATNRQVEILSDALAESRREVAARRKPLNDAQLLYAYNSLPSWDWDLERLSPHLKKFARAIEAAHGIKELKT